MTKRIAVAVILFSSMVLVHPSTATGSLIAVTQAAFSGSETLVDFNTPFVDEVLLTNQYSGLGVTFTGSIFTMQSAGDTSDFPSNGGGQIASNWLYSQSPGLQGNTIDILFSNSVNRVGFWTSMWQIDTLTVTAFSGATNIGSVAFAGDDNDALFNGVQDAITSFDHIRLEVSGPNNNFLAIDDLVFESGAVPEPASLAIFGLGALGLVVGGGIRRRRQQ